MNAFNVRLMSACVSLVNADARFSSVTLSSMPATWLPGYSRLQRAGQGRLLATVDYINSKHARSSRWHVCVCVCVYICLLVRRSSKERHDLH